MTNLRPDHQNPPRIEAIAAGGIVLVIPALRADGEPVELRAPISVRHGERTGRDLAAASRNYLAACG